MLTGDLFIVIPATVQPIARKIYYLAKVVKVVQLIGFIEYTFIEIELVILELKYPTYIQLKS